MFGLLTCCPIRFGQTWSETKTLQIVLESFWVHSHSHAFSYFSHGGFVCLPSLSSLKPAFLHCGVHPFLPVIPFRSPSLAMVAELSSLSLCTISLQWVSVHSFLLGKDTADGWPGGERYSCSLQPLVVSLLSLIHSCLFSD